MKEKWERLMGMKGTSFAALLLCCLLALGGLALAFCGLALYARLRGVPVPLRIVRVLGSEKLDEGEIEL